MKLTHCKSCGYRLWSEVLAFGAFRFVAHFDDARSATHGEHTPDCPGCGRRLNTGMMPQEPDAFPICRKS
jgi:C4-type Zn-finger protein